jgi:hypothetical protein
MAMLFLKLNTSGNPSAEALALNSKLILLQEEVVRVETCLLSFNTKFSMQWIHTPKILVQIQCMAMLFLKLNTSGNPSAEALALNSKLILLQEEVVRVETCLLSFNTKFSMFLAGLFFVGLVLFLYWAIWGFDPIIDFFQPVQLVRNPGLDHIHQHLDNLGQVNQEVAAALNSQLDSVFVSINNVHVRVETLEYAIHRDLYFNVGEVNSLNFEISAVNNKLAEVIMFFSSLLLFQL